MAKSIFYPFFVILGFASIFGLVLVACDKTEPETEEESEEALFEQRLIHLANSYEFGAKPIHEAFTAAAQELNTRVASFVEAPDLDRLETAREQWRVTASLFKQCEIYEVGDINASFIHYRIYRWPIELATLKDTLNTSVSATKSYVTNLGSHLVGLGAMEYLMFSESLENTVTTFQTDSKKSDYLKYTSQYVSEKAAEMETILTDYGPTFITATQSRVSGGQNQLTNSILAFLEETATLRLGKPLGDKNGGELELDLVESPYADNSLAMIKAGFAEWKVCFNGNFAGSSDNYGFDDYLISLEREDLVTVIQQAADEVDNALDQLTLLLDDLQNNKAAVVTLQDKFDDLSQLMRADLASATGATITPNDSDGD